MAIGFTLLGSGGHLGVGGVLLEGHPVGSSEQKIQAEGDTHDKEEEENEGPGSGGHLAVDTWHEQGESDKEMFESVGQHVGATHDEQDEDELYCQLEEEAGEAQCEKSDACKRTFEKISITQYG